MKHILLVFLLSISISGFGQLINGATQIKPGTITEPLLAPNALRPISSGVLSTGVLTFDEPKEVFTKTVDADLALSLAGSGHVAYSQIILNLTGDGSHVVTWPATWQITGTYNPNATQTLTLDYNGSVVKGEFSNSVDIIEVNLTEGIVTAETPSTLSLTFDGPVNITADGWTLEADGATVSIAGLGGSGTATPAFALVRDIEAGEVLTLSYAPASGETTSLTGNELETITDHAVIGIPTDPTPPTQECDILVCATGGDYTTGTAAVAAANEGDIICFCEGTYRETLTLQDNNLTLTNVTGDDAYISGFDVMGSSGWTVHSGNIYKKTVSLPVNGFNTSTSSMVNTAGDFTNASFNTTIFANQILRNGVMMPEARWPNMTIAGTYGTDNYLLRSSFREWNWTQGFTATQLDDPTIPFNPAGGQSLVGATLVSNGWISQDTRTISTHPITTRITYPTIWGNGGTNDWHKQRYYFIGKLFLLDAQGEWFYDGTTLYFRQPGDGTPTGTIEYKARNWGIDGRGRSGTNIKGLKFIGCEPFIGNTASTNTVIDQIYSRLQNHHVRHDVFLWQGVGMSRQFGLRLLGANSVVKNSEFEHGGSSGIWCGPNALIQNNYFHDWGYVGMWANPVSLWNTDGGQTITRNTFYRTGRSGFDFGYNFGVAPGTSFHYNVTFTYNDVSWYGMLISDNGGTYTWGQCDLFGLNYSYNWIHDNKAPDQAAGVVTGNGIQTAIYFDQSTGPGEVHHNVTWNAGDSDVYHETTNPTRPGSNPAAWTRTPPLIHFHHNTFATSTGSVDGSVSSYRSYITTPKDPQDHNIYLRQIVNSWGGSTSHITSSVFQGTNPLFVGGDLATDKGHYFLLQSGSPAVALGAGAYTYGDPDPWTAGHTTFVESGEVNDTEFTYSAPENYNPNPYNGSRFINNDHHVINVASSYATYAFHGTKVEVIMEACDNMGTARIQVLEDDGVTVVDTDDVNLFLETGAGLCDAGVVDVVYDSGTLAEDDYIIKVILQSGSTIVLDGAIITP